MNWQPMFEIVCDNVRHRHPEGWVSAWCSIEGAAIALNRLEQRFCEGPHRIVALEQLVG